MARWLRIAAALIVQSPPPPRRCSSTRRAGRSGPISPTTAGSRSCGCAGSPTSAFRAAAASARRGTTTTRAPNSTCRRILHELTALDIRTDGSLILTLDDPELFKYPIAFMWEPGFWNLTDREAESFRAYLLKGGFAVFEDFDGAAAVEQLRSADAPRAAGRPVRQARQARIASSTRSFRSRTSTRSCTRCPASAPSYYGIFEDNDPSKRLMVVANFDNDVPGVLGVVGAGLLPVRRVERGVQARRQLPDLRADALETVMRLITRILYSCAAQTVKRAAGAPAGAERGTGPPRATAMGGPAGRSPPV